MKVFFIRGIFLNVVISIRCLIYTLSYLYASFMFMWSDWHMV